MEAKALLGEQLQFFTNDVHEYGAWAQVAYAIIKELDISALGGTSQLNKADVQDGGGGRLSNAVVGGMLRYRMYGFTLGLEYYHVMAVSIAANGTGAPSGAGAPNGNIDVNQGMLSAMFFF